MNIIFHFYLWVTLNPTHWTFKDAYKTKKGKQLMINKMAKKNIYYFKVLS